ncbi:hyalin-like, partial [Acanthaster planci]|uniref:Hyalin-like n=1 Tax=Acanthaster planci TaxID=133434 RepID=A0A8B8A6U1_ACAPL
VNIICPENITVSANLNNFAYVFWSPPVLSFSGVDQSVTVISDHDQGQRFDIGTTLVTNRILETESQCQFSVTVKDDEPPKVSGCPDDVIIPVTSSSQLVTHSWIPPILTDNSGQDVSVTFNCSPTTFSECNRAGNGSFAVGDTTVRYTARDMSENRNVCAFTVTGLCICLSVQFLVFVECSIEYKDEIEKPV